MLKRVRDKFKALLNDYVPVPDVTEYIVTPELLKMVLQHWKLCLS